MGGSTKEDAKISPLLSGLIGNHSLQISLITFNSGGVVGAIEISITYPTEYLKTVLQLDKTKYDMGMINLAKETYRS
jgi:hypothetical protein